MIDVSVIIPTYNRLTFIYPTVLCLLNQKTTIEYEIVIIDSGTDNTETIIKTLCHFANINLVYKKIIEVKNRALLRNTGAKFSHGKYLIFLDNDILVAPDFIENHYNLLLSHKRTVVLGKRKSLTNFDFNKFGTINLKYNFHLLDKLPWYKDIRENLLDDINVSIKEATNQWRFLFSHNFSMEKKYFIKIKGFNEIFGENWGYEDLELGFRLFQKKYNFYLSTELTGYHQTHFEESKIATKEGITNAKLFLSLHNCIEFELYSCFYNNLDTVYKKALIIKKKYFDGRKIPTLKNTLILGCLWTANQHKKIEDGCLGVSLSYLEEKFDNIFIINTFYHFDYEIQCSIISESIRLCKNNFFVLEKPKNYEINIKLVLSDIGNKLGYEFKFTYGAEYTITFKQVSNNTFLSISLPDLFEPAKRFQYLSLTRILQKQGYTLFLTDKKGRRLLNNEFYCNA